MKHEVASGSVLDFALAEASRLRVKVWYVEPHRVVFWSKGCGSVGVMDDFSFECAARRVGEAAAGALIMSRARRTESSDLPSAIAIIGRCATHHLRHRHRLGVLITQA